jgi:hypothetical protein
MKVFNICLQIKGTPKECLVKTLLDFAPTFQISCGCYREKEGLHANSRVEDFLW